uniref:sensor histidine kinase n=1 Tax=Acetivibrio cellulolyticus TaxID=35830 RepID=UPI0002481B2D|nr:PAS domain-containing sensor histidine kinase [Acetivibrio cellulolyticus]
MNNLQHLGMTYIKIFDNKAIEFGDAFLELTKFEKNEILNMDISHILHNLLRLHRDILECMKSQENSLIFTKELEPREVRIIQKITGDEKLIFLNEVPNSRIDEKFPYLQALGLTEMSGVAFYSAADHRLIKANETYLNFLDEPFNKMDNCIGKRIDEIISGYKGSKAEEIWEDVFNTGKAGNIRESRFDGYKRGITYWDSCIIPIYEGGKIKYFVENATEVTERVLNRQKIEEQNKLIIEQNKKLEAILHNTANGVFVLSKDNRVHIANGEVRKYIYDYADYRNKGDIKYYDSESREMSSDNLPSSKALRGETVKNLFVTVKTPENTINTVGCARPIFDENGNVESAVLYIQDVTELVQSKEKIQKQDMQLEAIINNMSDAIFIFDKDYKCILKNQSAHNFEAYLESNFYDIVNNMKYYNFDGSEIALEDTPVFLVRDGQRVIDKVLSIKAKQKDIYVGVSGTPIFDEKGNFSLGVVVCRNISTHIKFEKDMRDKQEALIVAERREKEALENAIKIKDEFLTTISHEFKTPLTVINAAIQTIYSLYESELSENVKKHLKRIHTNYYRQLKLVNNLIDMSKYREGHIQLVRQDVDIISMTGEIIKFIQPISMQKGVYLQFDSDLESKVLAIDEEKYERILLNLLSNAIKYTPSGKSIYVNITFKGQYFVLTVRDEGLGIPIEKHECIFEHFVKVDTSLTRLTEGTGIGLSLVKWIVSALGGSISLESEVGVGSTFAVTLPVIKSKIKSTKKSKDKIGNGITHAAAIEFSDIYF